MRKSKQFLAAAIVACLTISMNAVALADGEPASLDADTVEYDMGTGIITATDNVLMKRGTERNNALISAAVKAQHYLSPETQKQLSDVDRQFGGADYVGLSDELFNAAKEKANTYFSAVEAAKTDSRGWRPATR